MNQVPTQQEGSGSAGFVVSALRGGSGKTILSIGVIAALRNLGTTVAPFKKGPDYIDAGWLALAAGRPCYNLDTFLIGREDILRSFSSRTLDVDIAVVEGNRGLYDAPDTGGETSTAELAKLLGLPVLLCIDCTKSTRTMAAVVSGCEMFDPDVNICGVVLNRVAGSRHEAILRKSIEGHCGIPVLGAVPKLNEQPFPERHMGLVPTPEHIWAVDAIRSVAEMAERYLDLDALLNMARSAVSARSREPVVNAAPLVGVGRAEDRDLDIAAAQPEPRIGVVQDAAFQFYYPENIEALRAAGGRVVFTSPLSEDPLPDVDALYIGGGFPETHARQLAENTAYRDRIRALAEAGLPIYAECGGLMYLGRSLVVDGRSYPMAGVFPFVFGFSPKPQGHGYTVVTVEAQNPYFPVGTTFRGHEFHYSSVLEGVNPETPLAFRMKRGMGIADHRDGACSNRVLATYTHIHALGLPAWAEAILRNARAFRADRKS